MKFLLYGSKGWIGGQILTILKDKNHEVYEGYSRIDNKEDVENEIKKINPSHIISCTGRAYGFDSGKEYPTIDYLELPGKLKENIRDNLFGPVSLALLSKKYGIHLTYLGTGCIFDYDDLHPFGTELNGFKENDKPNYFGSSYSIVKGFTDELMQQMEVMNVRIRMPITCDNHKRDFITKILNYKKICSIPNSMTVLPDLLPIMVNLAEKRFVGTINLTNPGLISHNEILEMYRDIVDPTFLWENFTKEEQSKILSSGRSNNYLDTSKLQKLYPCVKNIKDSIRDLLKQLKQKNKKIYYQQIING